MKTLPVLLSVIVMPTLFVFAGDPGENHSGNETTDSNQTTDQSKSTDAKKDEGDEAPSTADFLKTILAKTTNLEHPPQNPPLFTGVVRNDYSPAGLYYEFHNASEDQIAYAIEVTVTRADKSTVELLIWTNCAPLTSTSGYSPIYQSSKIGTAKLSKVYYLQSSQ